MSALEGIKHVVVLMLENRSFDCMLGALYPSDGTFEGITLHESNVFNGQTLPVWRSDEMGPFTACIPDPDPGESFDDMNQQLFGGDGVVNDDPPPMSGFVQNYMAQGSPSKPPDPMAVMHYFTPAQLPVMTELAKAFGVCDQWYASAPCQTWPNRFFAHAATCLGHVNNHNFPIPFTAETIFRRLSRNNRTWAVYHDGMPQSILCGDIWLEAPSHFHSFSNFLVHAEQGALPNYSFIEPRYFANWFEGSVPNDQHPPHDVTYGEQLIAQVYNAVRAAPTWKQTLLVITYDEHGGCFDHMPPPRAVPPDANNQDGFNFDRYGVRVPAIIISPYMPPRSKVRVLPQGLPHQGPPYPFDHTSIIATLRRLFDLGPPLSQRDAAAPDLLGPLSLANPANDGPPHVGGPFQVPTSADLANRSSAPLNDMQAALTRGAQSLPPAPASVTGVPDPAPLPPLMSSTVVHAAAANEERLKIFLGAAPPLGTG